MLKAQAQLLRAKRAKSFTFGTSIHPSGFSTMHYWTRLLFSLLLGSYCLQAYATELTAAVFVPAGSTWSKPFEHWLAQVNTSKDIKIRLIGPEALPNTEQVQALKEGHVQIIVIPTGSYLNWIPEAAAQDLSNMTLAEQRASGGYEALNQLLRQRINAKALTTYGTGVPYQLYLSQPIAAAHELRGQRIRAHVMHMPFFESLDMQAAHIDHSNLTAALDYAIVSGYGSTLWGIDDSQWQHNTAQRIDPGFYNASVNVLINYDTWRNLTQAEKRALTQASAEFEKRLPSYTAEQNRLAYQMQTKAGISSLDLGPDFAAQAERVYWQKLEQAYPQTIPMLKKLLTKPHKR